MLEKNISINIKLTPEDLAEVFCNEFSSDEQAEFFNQIANVTSKWSAPFFFQLQAITDEEGLSSEGRFIMRQIGEYAYKMIED